MLHFINPNLHVILIHYPLGMLAVGLLVEIFAFLWRTSSLRVAGRWMILLGALATVPAATTGLYAKAAVVSNMAGYEQPGAAPWRQVRTQANLSDMQWKWLNQHVLFNSLASALSVVAVVIWLSGSDRWRRAMHIPVLVLLVAAMGMMVYGAYGGGEMVYATRFATLDESQARALKASVDPRLNSADHDTQFVARTEYYVSPLQWHLISAGFVIASAAAALGLSLRKTAHIRVALIETHSRADALMAPDEMDPTIPMSGEPVIGRVITADPAVLPVVTPLTPPASRFWLLTAVLALMTIAGGWFTMTFDGNHPLRDIQGTFNEQIWQPFHEDPAGHSITSPGNHARLLAHFVIGSTILILPFILMAVSRWGGGSRVAVSFFGLLLTAAVVAQLGVGLLLLYDQDTGPLSQLNGTGSPAIVLPPHVGPVTGK